MSDQSSTISIISLIVSVVSGPGTFLYNFIHNKAVGKKTSEALILSEQANEIALASNKKSDKANEISNERLQVLLFDRFSADFMKFNNIFYPLKNKNNVFLNNFITDLPKIIRKNDKEINEIFLFYPNYKETFKEIKEKLYILSEVADKLHQLRDRPSNLEQYLDKPDALNAQIKNIEDGLLSNTIGTEFKDENRNYLDSLLKMKENDDFVRKSRDEYVKYSKEREDLEKEIKTMFDDMYNGMEKLATHEMPDTIETKKGA